MPRTRLSPRKRRTSKRLTTKRSKPRRRRSRSTRSKYGGDPSWRSSGEISDADINALHQELTRMPAQRQPNLFQRVKAHLAKPARDPKYCKDYPNDPKCEDERKRKKLIENRLAGLL